MRNQILILFITLISLPAFSQLDISLQYERPVYADWQSVVNEHYNDEATFMEQAYYIGLAYRYYPFSFRVGFIPEIGLGYGTSTHLSNFYSGDYSITQINIAVPVQLFPMDLYGDCNCPTFGKQNDFFKKAVYFKVIPGIAYQLFALDTGETQNDTNIALSLGAGIGLNIALSNLITIAPEVSYSQIFSETWNGFSAVHNQFEGMDHSSASKFNAGIRISFYFE